jgi:hypothetical protein
MDHMTPSQASLSIDQLRDIALSLRLRALRGQPNAALVADALDSLIRTRHAAITQRVREPARRTPFSIRW